MSGSHVLSSLQDSMEGILGNLANLLQCSIKQEQVGKLPWKSKGSVYNLTLEYAPDIKMLDITKKPTYGQLDDGMLHVSL